MSSFHGRTIMLSRKRGRETDREGERERESGRETYRHARFPRLEEKNHHHHRPPPNPFTFIRYLYLLQSLLTPCVSPTVVCYPRSILDSSNLSRQWCVSMPVYARPKGFPNRRRSIFQQLPIYLSTHLTCSLRCHVKKKTTRPLFIRCYF